MLRTERQRKTLCKKCPIAKVADLVGDPCSLLIARDLEGGPKRFGELDSSLCMSTKTLTKALRRLARAGLVERRGLPRQVEYRLTPKGRALKGVLEEMRAYGKKHL